MLSTATTRAAYVSSALRLVLGVLSCCLVLPVGAAQVVVTTANDDGAGSLRQAITEANDTPGSDTIVFDIPEGACDAAGVCSIELLSTLPDLNAGVVIDATTQPRYGAAPANVCAVDGAPLRPRVQLEGDIEYLLRITSQEMVTVRGLALMEAETGIRIERDGQATVQCTLFGIAADGSEVRSMRNGICLGCDAFAAGPCLIGTDGDGTSDLAESNVFAGGFRGVNINTGGDSVISGNLFGLRPDGSTLASVGTGVYIRQGASNNLVGSNLDGLADQAERNIFGAASWAVWIASRAGSGDDNLVVGNWIGLDAEGGAGLVETGIQLGDEGQNHIVANNRIEFTDTGILIEDGTSLDTTSTGNCIQNNATGLRHEGTAIGLAAVQNWWGDASGPAGEGSGQGDVLEITGDGSVDFDPWLTAPPASCADGAGELSTILVPAAAVAAGAEGSFFVTDLEVNNGGAATATFVLRWLPRNTDNATPMSSDSFAVAPGESRRFDNVLATVFGLSESVGALLVQSESSSLSAMSRTFNQGAEGTFGQGIPGVREADLVAANERVRVLFMSENTDFRSNLGLVAGNRPTTVRYRLHAPDGTLLGEGSRSLSAYGNTQINQVFAPYAPVAGGYVDVWTETSDGRFTGYGSVVDNVTSDPTTVLPQ